MWAHFNFIAIILEHYEKVLFSLLFLLSLPFGSVRCTKLWWNREDLKEMLEKQQIKDFDVSTQEDCEQVIKNLFDARAHVENIQWNSREILEQKQTFLADSQATLEDLGKLLEVWDTQPTVSNLIEKAQTFMVSAKKIQKENIIHNYKTLNISYIQLCEDSKREEEKNTNTK